jgi:DivIVA domain-containing protein
MELSGRMIEDRRFGTSMRGYTKAEVDEFLAAVGAHVSSVEERLAIAEAKATRSHDQLESLQDDLESRIADAQQARAKILDEARAEAAAITARAGGGGSSDGSRAAAIVAEAEAKAALRLREVDGIVEEARARARRIEAEATTNAEHTAAEAERLLSDARREAKRIREETERYRTEMQSHLSEVRGMLDAASATGSDDGEIVVDLREDATSPIATPESTR